jgi:hypothetical protein
MDAMTATTGWFPEEPDVLEAQRGEGPAPVRYEDIAQDGRLMLLGIPHVIGDVLWRGPVTRSAPARLHQQGIVPILTRFVIEGGDGPLSVRNPLWARGSFELSHTVEDGAVKHLLLNMWATVHGPRAHTHGPVEAGGSPDTIYAGRIFAEHVFTRLFAPPAERRVTRLDLPGLEPVPPARWSWRPLEAVLELPDGAAPLDEAATPDDSAIAFGLQHTDSNQHVNSLVYPRLFMDSALRRLGAKGIGTALLPRRFEVAYRKPCFAGEKMRFLLRTYRLDDWYGAVGALVPDGSAERGGEVRPHCTIHATFSS